MAIAGITFDAFGTLFDLEGLRPGVEAAVGARGGEVFERYPQRLIPLTWHLTAGGHYRPLPEVAALALRASAAELGIELSEEAARRALSRHFSHLLAADDVGAFKPAPAVYALATAAFGAAPAEVLLVSGNEWDVAGAKQAGLRGAWVARGRSVSRFAGVEPDVVVEELADLPAAVARL